MTKTVIVTGANGFIGWHALLPLQARGFDVVAITSRDNADLPPGVRTEKADLRSPDQVRGLMLDIRPTHLLHFAWHPVAAGLWMARENLQWVQHSLELADAFAESGGKRMVFSGSCGEYDWRGGLCVEDVTPLRPSTYYGACKHALQTLLEPKARMDGLSFAWGRAFFVYGPREHQSRLGASVIHALLDGKEAPCSHGRQLRDYSHVADIAEGYVALLDSTVEGDFNIGSGEAIRVKDLIFALAHAAGDPGKVKIGARDAPAFEPPLIVADMTKTFAALNWRPRYTLETGAVDTVDTVRRQRAT